MTIWTCQICGRAIKAKSGLIAHHGYTRPGQGWQTASCWGANNQPYEVSCEALKRAIPRLREMAEHNRQLEQKLRANPLANYDVTRKDAWGRRGVERLAPKPEGFDGQDRGDRYTNDDYILAFRRHMRLLDTDAKQQDAAADDLQKRLDEWKPPAE